MLIDSLPLPLIRQTEGFTAISPLFTSFYMNNYTDISDELYREIKREELLMKSMYQAEEQLRQATSHAFYNPPRSRKSYHMDTFG